MAVPKKKHSKQRTRTRHTEWQRKTQKKILDNINIVTCSNCAARIPERTACPECGFYKGVQIIKTKKASATATVIKV